MTRFFKFLTSFAVSSTFSIKYLREVRVWESFITRKDINATSIRKPIASERYKKSRIVMLIICSVYKVNILTKDLDEIRL